MTSSATTTSPLNNDDDAAQQQKTIKNRDWLRDLGSRIGNPKNPGPPPWAWTNLSTSEAQLIDQALDEYVEHYNRIHAAVVDEVIPRCWRKHPAVAQELPVQFWAWWASHIDVRATVPTALEYYTRSLPAFQSRLPKLLGKGATSCRKGHHMASTDPELIDAISFATVGRAEDTGRSQDTRQLLHREDFGTLEGSA